MTDKLLQIKAKRKKLGWTQTQLAVRAGVSQSLVAKIEAGRLDPTYSNARKLLDALESQEKKEELTASDVMSTRTLSVKSSASIREAVTKMKKNGFSQLPVIDNGMVAGRVNETVLLEALLDGKHQRIEEIMKSAPPTVSFDTPLSAVSVLLRTLQMVLVSKKGKIVGVVTKTDLLDKMY